MAKTIRDLHKNNKNEKPFGKSTFFLYVFFYTHGRPPTPLSLLEAAG